MRTRRCATLNVRELVVRRAAARAQPLPRPLPEAGARPHRAVGEARVISDFERKTRLPRAASRPGIAEAIGRLPATTARSGGREADSLRRASSRPSRRRRSTGSRSRPSSRSPARRVLDRPAARAAAPPPGVDHASHSCSRSRACSPPAASSSGSGSTSATTARSRRWRHGARRRVRRLPRRSSSSSRRRSRCCCRSRTSGASGSRRPSTSRCMLLLGARHAHHDDRQRPHRRVPRARGALDPAVRAGRVRPPPAERRRKPASSTSCSARSRRRSSSTASRSCTAPPAPRRSPASRDFLAAEHAVRERRRCSRASRCSSSGSGFKVAAVPFHMWTPDVYQGAPTPVTAFMASATKAAGFAALLRVFLVAFPLYRDRLAPGVWALAMLTLASAASPPCVQTDVKRLLAYSSIAHAGLHPHRRRRRRRDAPRGLEAALFYLFVYTFMTIGVFAVVTWSSAAGRRRPLDSTSYRGLACRRPVLGGLLAFFLLAQADPAHRRLRRQAARCSRPRSTRGEYCARRSSACVAAVVAAFFYLRVVVAMYAGDDRRAGRRGRARRRRRGRPARRGACSRSPPRDARARHRCPACSSTSPATPPHAVVDWAPPRRAVLLQVGGSQPASRRHQGRRSVRRLRSRPRLVEGARRRAACASSMSIVRAGEVEQLAVVDGRGSTTTSTSRARCGARGRTAACG